MVDPEAQDRWLDAIPDVEHAPVRADGQHSWSPRGQHLGLRRKTAGVGIHSEGCNLFLV
jgi:hypothetical protein